ncbi:hypothetical protein [Amycolatopsis sp. NPDC059020]|uniref:hypothetical protein n=1 Tax=Amycolatopsis sp. NPDC059020 TaxID=3346703 RepID=UPI00366FBDDC
MGHAHLQLVRKVHHETLADLFRAELVPQLLVDMLMESVIQRQRGLRELETLTHEARHRFVGDDPGALTFALVTTREVATAVSPWIAQTTHQLHGAMGITREAKLRWRTKLLWAGCDEGVAGPDRGAEAVPADEPSLWSRTTPGTLRGSACP